MPSIEVSDDVYCRVEEFRALAQVVLNDDIGSDDCFGIVLELGLGAGLTTIISQQHESVLAKALHLLADREPKLIYGHFAEMIQLGSRIAEHERNSKKIGFR
jgi:hypothetical protein